MRIFYTSKECCHEIYLTEKLLAFLKFSQQQFKLIFTYSIYILILEKYSTIHYFLS